MADFRIKFDESTNEYTLEPIPRRTRDHKGKSLVEFPETYVVIDIETTGLDPVFDDIIELGALKCENGIPVSQYQTLVNPGYEIDDFIIELTGITNEMLSDAPTIRETLPHFLAFIGDSIVVGHNVNFDINFIYDNAEHLELSTFTNDFVDTMRISRRLYKDLENHKLSTLSKFLGVETPEAHRAIADCSKTQMCFEKMRRYADKIGGIPEPEWKSFNKMAKSIVPETTDFDPDSPIYGMAFAFTGKLERMTRKEAMQAVANAGGICCDGVVAETNYLVIGNLDYCKSIKGNKSAKQKKAEKMQRAGSDIATISEDVFYDMLEQK